MTKSGSAIDLKLYWPIFFLSFYLMYRIKTVLIVYIQMNDFFRNSKIVVKLFDHRSNYLWCKNDKTRVIT